MTTAMTDPAHAPEPSAEQAAPPWYDLPPEAANREALEDSIATAGTAHQVDKLTRLYRKVTGEQERQAALRQQQQRYLKLRTDAEGMLVVSGRLPPEVGAALKRALESACQALESEHQSINTHQ